MTSRVCIFVHLQECSQQFTPSRCVCVCVCVCVLHLHLCSERGQWGVCVCVCECVCVCVCVLHLHLCSEGGQWGEGAAGEDDAAYLLPHQLLHAEARGETPVAQYVPYTDTRTHAHTHTHSNTHKHTHTRTHTHTHTHTHRQTRMHAQA